MTVNWLPEEILGTTTKRMFKGWEVNVTVRESDGRTQRRELSPELELRELYYGLVAGAALCRILEVPFAVEINQIHHADKITGTLRTRA